METVFSVVFLAVAFLGFPILLLWWWIRVHEIYGVYVARSQERNENFRIGRRMGETGR